MLNRRRLLASSAAFVAFAGPAFSMTAASAERLVNTVTSEINKSISSGKSDSAIMRDFVKLFDKYADVKTIARYALGRDARRATAAEIKNFTNVFKVYIARKYGARFREFIGGQIKVTSSKKVKKFFEVKTKAVIKNKGSYEVVFLVSDRSGKPLFFNIFVEGVNLLLTERAEIGALLDRNKGDIAAMTAALKKSA